MLFWDHTGLEELWVVLGFLFYLSCSVCLESSPTWPTHTPGRRRDWWEGKSTVGHLYFKQPWVPAALPSLLTLRRLVFFSMRMKPALFLPERMNNAERPARLLALMFNKLLTLLPGTMMGVTATPFLPPLCQTPCDSKPRCLDPGENSVVPILSAKKCEKLRNIPNVTELVNGSQDCNPDHWGSTSHHLPTG